MGLRSLTELFKQLFPKVKLRNGLTPRVFGCVSYVHSHNMQTAKSKGPELCICWILKHTESINSITLQLGIFSN